MPVSPLPVPNSTTSFWRSSPHPLDDHRSTPELPAEVDIAVIGAGYAGVATVYHILDQCKARGVAPPKVLILEARQACSGATGRNGGHLKPDPYNRPASFVSTHGIETAKECAEFEAKNLMEVKKTIEAEGIDCDFVLTRAVDALMSESIRDKMKANVELLRKAGVSVMKDVYYADGAEAEQLSGVKGVKGCLSYTAGTVWPYKLILALLSKALDAGVNLQTHTPVEAVTSTPDADGYLTLTTGRGAVRAAKIVYATNGYTSSILPEFADKIVPVRGICSHITPGKTPAPLLPHSVIIRWSDTEYEYLIPRLDGSIVVGGARSSYYHDLSAWYNKVNDDELIEAAKTHFDGYMQRVFRGWEDSGATTSKVWTGIMGYSSDGLPHVGVVPGKQKQFIIAGFNGHGMPQIFLSAKGVASMIMEQSEFKTTGIPKVYQASQARLDSSRNSILESWKSVNQPPAKL
ncbi:FAD dependent oxidoreductase [Colletotrichum scovillei]|uniref:FAD dependent oxidoreductase n=1 Tax=Colletotrichum scovillei TaxID=1209932 RepID=A0A9P7RGR1_9PEZI|nr:FAD dependent oxidoreductase [Colletotrichum scovillei]KAF4779150.1 FAD dependent oxidoreductase [Colletotrichum scovillei]KAG7057921.1 FAD dependent oxidoreductase [Colletotrichum scovillei]KAG7076466.1 FAD dependent oxidoreductase [Colletotrichum scovillei]KAG7083670.1 FAD dependent oxidoreductase [Colletotrichum scovillei]